MRYIIPLLLLCSLLLGFHASLHAQDTLARQVGDSGMVRIFKDPRLDLLIKKQIEVNEYNTRASRRITAGYRILVANTKDRQEAINAKAMLYDKFPELKSYLWHQSPYYKLKVGNFRTKEDAEAYAEKLRPFFQKGIFLMNDEIDTYFINALTEPNKK